MPYRVPSDEEVVAAITSVLSRHGIVRSQKRLKLLVDGQLSRIDAKYRVSLPRVRQLAVASGFAQVNIHSRRAPQSSDLPIECPVCGQKMAPIRNKTLEGKRAVSFERKCGRCGYFTGRLGRVPTRYVFHKKA